MHYDFRPSGTVSCPICMDGYSEVSRSHVSSQLFWQQDEMRGLLPRWEVSPLMQSRLAGTWLVIQLCVKGECASSLGPLAFPSCPRALSTAPPCATQQLGSL